MNGVYIKNKFLFFKSARLIFNNSLFLKWVKNNRHSLIVLITQKKINNLNLLEKTKKTTNIKLNREIDSILASFNDTTRNEVRRTFKVKNLKFKKEKTINDNVFEIYKRFRKAKNLPLQDRSFLESADLYLAYLDNKPISFVTVYDVFPYLRVQNIFSDELNPKIKNIVGYSTRRLIYEICKYGSQNRYEFLDLAGINLDNPKKQGITKFKMGFGGEIVPEYSYTYKSPLLRKITRIFK